MQAAPFTEAVLARSSTRSTSLNLGDKRLYNGLAYLGARLMDGLLFSRSKLRNLQVMPAVTNDLVAVRYAPKPMATTC
jgi:hypothetical protein